MNTHIALDGPLNGTYITAQQAEDNGYVLAEWMTGENAYLYLEAADDFAGPDKVPVEILREMEQAWADESNG